VQGIYKGYELMLHDIAWTVLLDLVQDENGRSNAGDALLLLLRCGGGDIWLP